jgi:MFS family permease
MILLCQSIIAQQAALEFHNHFPARLTIAAYVGMLVGAPLWGVSADIIGRKVAFNSSLILCSVFAILVGLSPHWIVLGTFLALCCMAAAGNLALDTTVCLEYFPNKYRWLLTMMAAWWGTVS